MKDLDEVLNNAKRVAAENAARQAAEAEKEAQKAVQDKLTRTLRVAKSADMVKNSLAEEGTQRTESHRQAQYAESRIDAKTVELEKHGITKEQLLSEPAYEDVVEVRNFKTAQDASSLYDDPEFRSIGSEAFTNKLQELGIEIPVGEMDEEHVLLGIEKRFKEIDAERTAVLREVIATYKLKVDRIRIEGWEYRNETSEIAGRFVDVSQQLRRQMDTVPIATEDPEVRHAITRELIKEELLKRSQPYQDAKERAEVRAREGQAYLEAQQKLPEYLEYLNKGILQPILNKLKEGKSSVVFDALRDLNAEWRELDKFYIHWGAGEIRNLQLKDPKSRHRSLLPSAQEMERQMNRPDDEQPWGRSRMETILENIDTLNQQVASNQQGGGRIYATDVFGGHLEQMLRLIQPKETVPEAWPVTGEVKAKWDSVFSRVEERANGEGKRLLTYEALVAEANVRKEDIRQTAEAYAAAERAKSAFHTAERAVREHQGAKFRFEKGRVINTIVEVEEAQMKLELPGLEQDIAKLKEDDRKHGEKPGPLTFRETAIQAWQIKHSKIRGDLKTKEERRDTIKGLEKNSKKDWTERLLIPLEYVRRHEGETIEAREVANNLMGYAMQAGSKMDELRPKIRENEARTAKITELERSIFIDVAREDKSALQEIGM